MFDTESCLFLMMFHLISGHMISICTVYVDRVASNKQTNKKQIIISSVPEFMSEIFEHVGNVLHIIRADSIQAPRQISSIPTYLREKKSDLSSDLTLGLRGAAQSATFTLNHIGNRLGAGFGSSTNRLVQIAINGAGLR